MCTSPFALHKPGQKKAQSCRQRSGVDRSQAALSNDYSPLSHYRNYAKNGLKPPKIPPKAISPNRPPTESIFTSTLAFKFSTGYYPQR